MGDNGSSRETLGSRLGFILLTAGCAIGLGNIWRFPFVTGQNGGALFVLIYLVFLFMLGFPVMVMELSLGRASRRNLYGAYKTLPKGSSFKWHWPGAVFFTGSAFLMIFYTTVTGWMIAYAVNYLNGSVAALGNEKEIIGYFNGFLASPGRNVGYMLLTVLIGSVTCYLGLQKGVERITKLMMAGLFLLLLGLCIRSCTLPGASAGLSFYLKPSLEPLETVGLFNIIVAALGQAFFTLSLGVGSIAIFGSYIDRDHSLAKESLVIIALDTIVAILAGVIIFPACFSYGVDAGSGPGLVFISLPNVFNHMPGGRWWGVLFFLFLSSAALTTVIAVFENLIAFMIDEWRLSRRKAVLLNGVGIGVLSLPCALGYNLLKWIEPLGKGSTILDLEDYIVSDNLLPLGSLYIVLFIAAGWGWKNFIAEANSGHGIKFPGWVRVYVCWLIPLLIFGLFAIGFYRRWLQ